MIKEFQRLKDEENKRFSGKWNLQRTLSKINYKIHTDAIKENIIPNLISKSQINFIYATEADILNVALFGTTAKQWKEDNPNARDLLSSNLTNMRDDASLEQLLVLSNMESINALLIVQGLSQKDRLIQLNRVAIMQMKSLLVNKSFKNLRNL